MQKLIRSNKSLNLRHITPVVALVVAVGIVAVVAIRAAGTPVAFEAESGTLAGGAIVTSVTSQSGGGAVKFVAAATPTPTAGACPVSVPNTPGGPDPWGGCFPGPSNTGVPAGTTLSAYAGTMTITVANTVIDSKTVTGTLRIKAAGVVVKNSLINGRVYIDNDDAGAGYSMTIQDTEVVGGAINPNDYNFNVGMADFTLIRGKIHGGGLGVDCESNCTVQDTYIYGMATDSTGVAHEGAIRVSNDTNVIHTAMLCDARDVPPDAGCSGDYTGYGDFAPVQRNLIQRNLIMASPAGFCAYGGSSGGKPYSSGANNIRFIQNVFQRGTSKSDHGKYVCGSYGAFTDFDAGKPGNVWSGNIWDDGTALPVDGALG